MGDLRHGILAALLLLLLCSCHSNDYERGRAAGYAEGMRDGREQGHQEGYAEGYAVAQPPGPELTGAASTWVCLGALLGGILLIGGLSYCLIKLGFEDLTLTVLAAKGAALAVGLLLTLIAIALLRLHKTLDFLLLAGRLDNLFLLAVIALVFAVPAFFAAAFFDVWLRQKRAPRSGTLFTASFGFGLSLALGIAGHLLEVPQPERYMFSYIALGLALGLLAFLAHRLLRKAEGW